MKKIKNQKPRKAVEEGLKSVYFAGEINRLSFSIASQKCQLQGTSGCFYSNFLLKAGLLLTPDQAGFHWCTLVRWFHTPHHCADKEPFFTENTAPSFCLCLSFPKSLHPRPYSGHVCYLRSGILIMPQLCHRTQTSSSTCSLLKLWAVVYLLLFEKSECSLFHGLLQHVLPLYLHCFLVYFCIQMPFPHEPSLKLSPLGSKPTKMCFWRTFI